MKKVAISYLFVTSVDLAIPERGRPEIRQGFDRLRLGGQDGGEIYEIP